MNLSFSNGAMQQQQPNISMGDGKIQISYANNDHNKPGTTPPGGSTPPATGNNAQLMKKVQLAENLNKIQGRLIASIKQDISGGGSVPGKPGERYTPISKNENSKPRFQPIDKHDDHDDEDTNVSFSSGKGNTIENSNLINMIFNLGQSK